MPRQQPPSSAPESAPDLQIVLAPDGTEWARAIAMASVGLSSVGPAHFHPDFVSGNDSNSLMVVLDRAWESWFEGQFLEELLSPALDAHRAAAGAGDLGALLLADARMAQALQQHPGQSGTSVEAGVALSAAVAGQKHFPLWSHFERAVQQGKTAGHFLTALMARASAFQIVPGAALAAAVYHEWRAAARRVLNLRQGLTPADFVTRHSFRLARLQACAFHKSSGESILRAI
ncbi:MAG: hypothetical protein IT576_07520 [Verrucomicrobiales bacterium]|nr:hypothetical protein [Verrucomicrobiales bacterium]